MLERTILAKLPTKVRYKYPPNTIIRVIKPLYGIAEAGLHWWKTYYLYHCNVMSIKMSTYNPCLLILTYKKDCFGFVAMQTDDTLSLVTPAFSALEEEKI